MINTLTLKLPLHRILKNTFIILISSILIAIAAQIQIPLRPVPVTLQNFAVLFVAMTLGWRIGGLAVAMYLLEGTVGFPVFANHMSFMELISPAGGYLWAFLPAAIVTGYLVEKGWGKNIVRAGVVALFGFTIIYAGGLIVLSSFVGWQKSLSLGVIPFLFGDSLKLIALAITIPYLKKS